MTAARVAWWRDDRLAWLGLGVVTGVVAWTYLHVFAGEPCGDDNTFHFAEVARLAGAIRHGDWAWWNPGGNSGYASGYYYQILPHAVPALFAAATGASALLAFQLAIFVPVVLAPLAGYRALRVLGCERLVALGGAVAMAFGVGVSRWGGIADGVFLVGLYTQLWAMVVFPLAFAHGVRWLEDGRGLAPTLAWGLVVGLSHPFAGVALGVALAATTGANAAWWLGARVLGRRAASPARPALRLLVLGALLLLGSACAWLPVLIDYDGFGGFPHRVGDEVGPGFVQLGKDLARGALFDAGRPAVLTALIPLAAVMTARERRLGRLWIPALLFALLLGVGPHLPKTGDDDLLPAVRFLAGLQVLVALAVGAGATAATLWAWRAAAPLWPWSISLRAAVASLLGLATVIVVVEGARVQRGRVKVAADFDGIGRAELDPLLAAMRAAPPGRLQVRGGAENHWFIMLPAVYADRPASLVMGGAPLQSSPNYVYMWELRDHVPGKDDAPTRTAWVFDAPLVVQKRDNDWAVTTGEVLAQTDTYELRRLPAPGLVGPVEVVGTLPAGRKASRAAVVTWLRSDEPYANQVRAWAGSGGAGGRPRGRTLAVTRTDATIRAEVEVEGDGPTTFVIRESWHPRWVATIDGAPAPLRRVTPDYLALDVPPGRHVLAVRFARPLWTWLLWLIGPLACVAAWLVRRPRTRDRAAAAAAAPPPPAATAS